MGTTEKSSSIAWRPTGDAAPKQPEVRELRAHVFVILLLGTWNVLGTGKRHCDRKFLSREIKADHKVLDQTKASSRNMVGSEAIIISIEGTSNALRIWEE